MPLGNPIRKQNESRMVSVLATEGQTVFTVQGGYIINHISVFRNGVRLSPAEDFTAGDGSTVTLNDAANIDDRIDFHIFDRFTVQNAIVGAASTQTINGDLVLNGKLFGELDVPSINLTGIITASNLNVTGISTFSNVDFSNLDVTGITTVGKQVHVGTGVSIAAGGLNVTAGISTFQAVQGTTGTFSGDVDIADKIIHTGDTNTAIRFPAADTVTVETGGSERVRVDSSGRVGISSSSPDDKFVISGSTGDGLKIIDGTHIAVFRTFSGGGILKTASNHALVLGTNDTERARITSGGDMGLGTNSPASSHDRVLTIAGTNSAELKLTGSNYGVTDTDGADVLFSYGGLYLINNESTGAIHFHTGSGVPERMRITSSGAVGINTTVTAATKLQVQSDGTSTTAGGNIVARFQSNGSGRDATIQLSDNVANSATISMLSSALILQQSGTERVRIDSSGRLLVNHSSARQVAGGNSLIQVEAADSTGRISIVQNRNEASGAPFLSLGKSRGTSVGSATIVQSGDTVGTIAFAGADGTDFPSVAQIVGQVDGTPGNNDMPGRLIFKTCPDNSDSTQERMRIDNHGRVMIGNDQGSTQYADGGDDLVIGNTSGAHGITVISQNNNVGRLMFSDTYSSGTETYEGQILYSHALNTMNFYANYTANQNIAMTIGGSNGDVTIHGGNLIMGTSGKGIDFSATGGGSNTSGESELFDDYEEGSCAILIHDAVGSNISVTGGNHKYTKIGNKVFVEGQFTFAETGSKNGGLMILYQLPFVPVQSGLANGTYWYDGSGDAADITGIVYVHTASNGQGYLKQSTTQGQNSNNKYLTFNEISANNARPLYVSFSYIAA